MYIHKRILAFNDQLTLQGASLPTGVEVLNPFRGDNADAVKRITTDFYQKYYSDNKERNIIFGINPGRMGAGLTGVPFADTWCLQEVCKIQIQNIQTRETSARFIFDMIHAFGGPNKFFGKFYIGAVSPLGYVKRNSKNRYVNYNYYDSKLMQFTLEPIIEKWFRQQYELGMKSNVAFCLGTGKNYKYLVKLNERIPLYDEIIPLEHPRYIMQYKLREKEAYITKFVALLQKG